MWTQNLLQELARSLPRWRWKHKLGHRGGWLVGTSQKDTIKIEIAYAKRVWEATFHRQTRGRKWVQYNEVTALNLDGLVSSIKRFCDER